jgi:hypothetical protein
MDIEDEIVKILDTIQVKDIRSISEINTKNNEIIDIVFENFSKYKKNIENLKWAKKKIKENEYEYIDNLEHLKPYDYLCGFNLSDFFDLRLKYIGFYVSKKENNNFILMKNHYNAYWHIDANKHILFRKLNSKDKVKMLLIDAVKKI